MTLQDVRDLLSEASEYESLTPGSKVILVAPDGIELEMAMFEVVTDDDDETSLRIDIVPMKVTTAEDTARLMYSCDHASGEYLSVEEDDECDICHQSRCGNAIVDMEDRLICSGCEQMIRQGME
jgi:hypothetical protein